MVEQLAQNNKDHLSTFHEGQHAPVATNYYKLPFVVGILSASAMPNLGSSQTCSDSSDHLGEVRCVPMNPCWK